MKKLVSINNLLTNLMDDLSLDHNKYKPMFVNWATRASKQISSWAQYKRKIAVITIEGCVAELPCDAAILEIAVLGDFGCDCYDLMNYYYKGVPAAVVTSSDTFLIIDTNDTSYINGLVPHHVQDGKIIFSSNLDAQSVTVQYRGIEVDSQGIPKVMDSQLEAISEYCMWKFKSRNVKSYLEKSICKDHEDRWDKLAARARGDDAALTEGEQQQIAGLLNNPLAGRSLYLPGTEL